MISVRWKSLLQYTLKAAYQQFKAGKEIVQASEVKTLKARIRELELNRAYDYQTVDLIIYSLFLNE